MSEKRQRPNTIQILWIVKNQEKDNNSPSYRCAAIKKIEVSAHKPKIIVLWGSKIKNSVNQRSYLLKIVQLPEQTVSLQQTPKLCEI